MDIQIVSLSVTVLLALLGYLATYLNNLQISKREAELELVTRRLEEFYGPLYVLTRTNHMAWEAFMGKIGKRYVFDTSGRLVDPTDLEEWMLWVEHIFMPQNERLERLIVEKAYLIQEEEMPQCMLDFGVHMDGYRAVVQKWHRGDISELFSLIDYPLPLDDYAKRSYEVLKSRQVALIGKSRNLSASNLPLVADKPESPSVRSG